MDRDALLGLLDDYARRHPDESATTERIRRLVHEHERAFHRDCLPGHVTASAWIVSRESRQVLLTHHRKLGRWLQLGGHVDGQTDVLAAAIREAEEESGLAGFSPLPDAGGPVVLDLDVHVIPARASEPAHEHHDVRFLLEVSQVQPIRRQVAESMAVRWFEGAGIEARLEEESLARMARKASDWLGRRPIGPP